MRQQVATGRRDAAVARIAARQHGVVSLPQLHLCGADASAIKRRVAAGRLYRLHRGVYAVGHRGTSNETRWMAAVLACGEAAVLSHASAAELWGMLRPAQRLSGAGREGHRARVDVTVPGISGRGQHLGIALHRSRTLTASDCTRRDSIPVTKPARTLEDLRRILPMQNFADALRQAEFLRLSIGEGLSPDHTRSELEARFLALCRRHRIPQPEVNVHVDRFVVDFLWRAQRLVAELDGWKSHRTRSAFEVDRARDARLKLLGYDVLRFTWRQVEIDGHGVARTVRSLLSGTLRRR
jgi:very-short-patch-repair endonuclease